MRFTEEQVVPPIVTVTPEKKLVPVNVIVLPPAIGPLDGVIEERVGASL